jgi:hypothetical protein
MRKNTGARQAGINLIPLGAGLISPLAPEEGENPFD